jgi:hypothetical protein
MSPAPITIPPSGQLQNGQVIGPSLIQRNRAVRKSTRKSAGRKVPDPAFLDPVTVIEDDDEEMLVSSESETSDAPPSKRKKAKKPKRRSPSPPPPPLSPVHPDMDSELSDLSSRDYTPDIMSLDDDPTSPVSLTFNVPKGFQGPFVVNFDPVMISQALQESRYAHNLFTRRGQTSRRSTPFNNARFTSSPRFSQPPSATSKAEKEAAIGFMTLPPELRNRVYRLLFVTKASIDSWTPSNFCRTSALLRTCRQINKEGASILYGENHFRFVRIHLMRAQYWANSTEIGYKDFRRFLTDIGPVNVSYLRIITICFEDARPSTTPHLHCNEDRRYLRDEHLLECLRILAKHSQINIIKLAFEGRRSLMVGDERFIDILGRIKADEVHIGKDPRSSWSNNPRISWDAEDQLKYKMLRAPKFYSNH